MYRVKGKSARFAQELKIVEALRKRLEAPANELGWTRIKMKVDGQYLDIGETVDGEYLVTFPPFYGDKDYGCGEMQYKPLHKVFKGLDEIAEFILAEGWRKTW